MTVGPSGTQGGIWRLLMTAPGGSHPASAGPLPPASRGRDTRQGPSVGLRPWADVGQEVPEAGHGSWTRSRRRPTATGDGQDTPLTRGAPTRRSRFPLVHGAAGRGGRGPARPHLCPGSPVRGTAAGLRTRRCGTCTRPEHGSPPQQHLAAGVRCRAALHPARQCGSSHAAGDRRAGTPAPRGRPRGPGATPAPHPPA